MMRYAELKDVPLPAKGVLIDGGVQDLVRALTALGFRTTESCEGHLDRLFTRPQPWVIVDPFPFSYPNARALRKLNCKLCEALEEYNLVSSVQWQRRLDYVLPAVSASDPETLGELQENAAALANFIFDKYIKKTKR